MGIMELQHSIVAGMEGKGVQKYAKLWDCTWANPSSNPFNQEYWEQVRSVTADIGIMTEKGFEIEEPSCPVIGYFGLCKGVFYLDELVPVHPWPFRAESAWMPKYALYGMGQITAWTEKVSGLWRIMPERNTGNGQFQAHYIAEGDPGGGVGPTFPGMAYPYTLDEGKLDSEKPVKWKWLDLEGRFTPTLQTPSGQ